jgi:hypothetical protein
MTLQEKEDFITKHDYEYVFILVMDLSLPYV